MLTKRRRLMQTATAAGLAPAFGARGQSAGAVKIGPIKIGVLADFSGPYRDTSGATSTACTQLAADEARDAAPGLSVEILQGDHLNKPDVALTIARQWFDRDGVDVITCCNNSAIALAISGLCHERNKVHLNTGAATVELTGPNCNANLVHWTYDTWELAHSTGVWSVKAGGTKWFLIAADYAFGHSMQSDLTRWVTQSGGVVLDTVFYPFPATSDFSAYMLQAQASGANCVSFLNAGSDFDNCVKQAHEFGLTAPAIRLAGTAVFITNIHSLGLEAAQGLTYTECFYWDLNDRTRAFTARANKRSANNYPNQIHAGDYAATTHYLKAVNQIGMAAAKASGVDVVQAMKAMPTDDDAYGPGILRVDGRHLHPAYLLQAKTPAESKSEWDLLKVVAITPTEEAFRPLSEGKCPLAAI